MIAELDTSGLHVCLKMALKIIARYVSEKGKQMDIQNESKTTKTDMQIVREFLDHPAFEDMPRNFQIKSMMASEAFSRIEEELKHV